MVFDGDAAGQKAAERSLDVLVPEDLDVRIFTVPDGADPCEAVRALGAETFQSRMEREAVSLFEFKWRRAMSSSDETVPGRSDPSGGQASPVARGRALDDCLTLLARVPNVITQKLLLREFAERIGVDEKEVALRFRKFSRPRPHRSRESQDPDRHDGDLRYRDESSEGSSVTRDAAAQPSGVRELRRVILECILALPHNAAEMWNEVPRILFQGEAARELAAAIDRQLESGQLFPERLVREVQDAGVQRALIEILDRVLSEDGEGQRQSPDYREVWGYALRDIRRYLLGKEIAELSGQMERARQDGATEGYRELCQARIEAKKKLKLMNRPAGGAAGASAG
jgi:DNA primase